MVDVPPSSRFTALLVEPDHVDRVSVHWTLAEAGFRVVATNNYRDAESALESRPPLILVTNVRLGAHNGLQLAIRASVRRPRMAVVVTSSRPDAILQAEAECLGATFVLKPVTSRDLLAAVYRTALRRNDARDAEPIRPPFERRGAERRVSHMPVPVDRRAVARRRDVAGILLALPAAV